MPKNTLSRVLANRPGRHNNRDDNVLAVTVHLCRFQPGKMPMEKPMLPIGLTLAPWIVYNPVSAKWEAQQNTTHICVDKARRW